MHIYDDHIDGLKDQLTRNVNEFPKLNIKKLNEKIEDYCLEDFEISNYNYNDSIKLNMRQ